MNANERFEYMAEQFYKKTGMLAPGKDCPAAFARSEEDMAKRDNEWRVFVEGFYANLFQTHADMYEILESKLDLIRCGIGANYSGDPKQNPKYLEVVELLKRARGDYEQ